MAKIGNIDNRNKTIEKPYVYKNKTFEKFLCQYSVFENEVRFENCIFLEEVVLGDESKDQAYCVIKSDLIFDGCTFKKKVKLDGLQCAGHVVIKGNCKFEYKGRGQDEFALSMSNAKIGIGVSLSDSVFESGINLSAINIEQVGCQFFNIRLNNPEAEIKFTSSYMGRELSINYSNIICKTIDFERTSVDSIHGSLQLRGKYYDHKSISDILSQLVDAVIKPEQMEWVASLYKDITSNDFPLVVSFSDKLNYGEITHIIETLTNGEINVFSDYHQVALFDPDRYAITGDLIILDNYIVLVANNRIYVSNEMSKESPIKIYNFDKYAHCVFSDIKLDKNENWDSFEISSHVGVPMIYATTTNTDKYIAIYDDNIGFKTYKWNYIECSAVSNMFQSQVGTGLYVGQSEFNVFSFDIHGLIAKNDIKFEDIVFRSKLLLASEIQTNNLTIHNVQFVFIPEKNNFWINSPSDFNWGVDLRFAKVRNKVEISGINSINQLDKTSFSIIGNYMYVGTFMQLAIITDNSPSSRILNIELKNSVLNQWQCVGVDTSSWSIQTENIHFKDFKIDNNWPLFKDIEHFWETGTIIGSREMKKSLYPIHFLREMDAILENFDRIEEQYKFWKLRNQMRLYRDYPKSAKLHILSNKLLLNYGWSTWRVVIWLVALIIAFDITTCLCFEMEPLTSIVNGFVEFVPISFNEPIVEQLHGVNPNDPKYGPPLLSLGYSALVTGYRLLSYTLLSVLIAAWAGYFRKKNQ